MNHRKIFFYINHFQFFSTLTFSFNVILDKFRLSEKKINLFVSFESIKIIIR